jgi:hypothetical protein
MATAHGAHRRAGTADAFTIVPSDPTFDIRHAFQGAPMSASIRTPLLIAACAAMLGGCSFVKVQENADDVLVLGAERVADCKRLGQTRVSVADKIGFIKRGQTDIRKDLEKLARNSAADMDGDTVSPESAIEGGKQTYGIYDCVR